MGNLLQRAVVGSTVTLRACKVDRTEPDPNGEVTRMVVDPSRYEFARIIKDLPVGQIVKGTKRWLYLERAEMPGTPAGHEYH